MKALSKTYEAVWFQILSCQEPSFSHLLERQCAAIKQLQSSRGSIPRRVLSQRETLGVINAALMRVDEAIRWNMRRRNCGFCVDVFTRHSINLQHGGGVAKCQSVPSGFSPIRVFLTSTYGYRKVPRNGRTGLCDSPNKRPLILTASTNCVGWVSCLSSRPDYHVAIIWYTCLSSDIADSRLLWLHHLPLEPFPHGLWWQTVPIKESYSIGISSTTRLEWSHIASQSGMQLASARITLLGNSLSLMGRRHCAILCLTICLHSAA